METTQSKVIAVEVTPNKYNSKVDQVMLRQEISRQYNGIQTTTRLKDSMFDAEQLGLEGNVYVEKRVAWDNVPVGFTVEQYQKLIDKKPNARLYKILSHEVILDDSQASTIQNGLRGEALASFNADNELEGDWSEAHATALIAKIASRQLVRYGEGNDAGEDADAPVLFNGKKQYRVIYLSLNGRVDIDLRNEKAVTEDIEIAPNPQAVTEKAKA